MLGGQYSENFKREEYGHAHSWMRPFGYPSWFEQSDEIGLVNRMNFLSNTGLNKITITKKECFSKKIDSGKKKLKKKKHLKKKK